MKRVKNRADVKGVDSEINRIRICFNVARDK